MAMCREEWGVTPHRRWAALTWGPGRASALWRSASNVVLFNGLLDPWHGGGVLQSLSNTVVALEIPEVGGKMQGRLGRTGV